MSRDVKVIAAVLGAITVVGAFTLSYLGGTLVPWDEQIYAGAAYSVLDGYVLVPHFQLAEHGFEVGPFLEKPPLAVWMQAITMGMIGETPFAARLPSGLAAGGVVALTVLLGSRWFNTAAGAFAGLILFVTNAMRATHAMQHAVTDMQLLLWGLLAVYAADRVRNSHRPRRWALLCGGALGTAILRKGIAGAPFVILVLPFALQNLWLYLSVVPYTAAALIVIALPWHILAYLSYPTEFIDEYIVEQLIERSKALHGHPVPGGLIPGSNFPYFKRMPGYFDLALLGAVGAVILDSIRVRSDRWPSFEVMFCYGWSLYFPLGYSIAGGDHIWYMLPSAIPLALLAGRFAAPIVNAAVTRLAFVGK